MTPTLSNVYDKARAVLGEHNIPSGEAFTDTVLFRFVDTAIRKLYAVMSIYDNTMVESTTYYALPANANVWVPSMSGVTNFGEPRSVKLASKVSNYGILSVTLSTTQTTLALNTAAPEIQAGDRVVIYGALGLLSGNINDEWIVTEKPTTSTVRIVGLIETASLTSQYQGSSGTLLKVGTWSNPLERVEDITQYSDNTNVYEWYRDSVRLTPSSQERVIQVEYSLSGAVPGAAADSIGIDGSLDFLGYYTAYLASSALGADRAASTLLMQAVGSDMTEDGRGGFLGDLISQGIDSLQQRTDVWPRFRSRRGKGVLYY